MVAIISNLKDKVEIAEKRVEFLNEVLETLESPQALRSCARILVDATLEANQLREKLFYAMERSEN